jgi:tetratricopeptide (TPR) repeat protein
MHTRFGSDKTAGVVSLFVLASVLYIGGLCPTIYWFDSPEFVTTAHTLGISHPSGSPTYSLLAKLAIFLPIGSVALRINAFSALVGAVTVTLIFTLLYTFLVGSSLWTRWLAALGGALFLWVSESFWRFAEVAEVYILQNCFLVILLTLLLKARASTQPLQRRYYWIFALLYGLSAGVHATMAFFVPAFIGFIGLTTLRMFRTRELAFLAFFFMLGFATYLYLPLRSLTEPTFNWGEPQTWQQFLIHISDRKDAAMHTVLWIRQLPFQISMYMTHLINEFSTLGVMLGLLGFLSLLRKDRALWFLFTVVLLGHTAFFIRTWWDTAWGFIPSFVIFALWIGYGLHTCLAQLVTWYQHSSPRIPRIALYAFLFGGIAVTLLQTLVRHASVANQTTNYATELYGKQLLAQLPTDAILFCEYSWFPLAYLQQVERQRPDLTFILQGEVFAPYYFTLVSTKRYPNIKQVISDKTIKVSATDYFWLLARLNEKEHQLFWDPDAKYQKNFKDHILPQGLLFTLHPNNKVDITPDILRRHWKLLSHSTNYILSGDLEDSTTFLLANKLNSIASHFRNIGAFFLSVKTYQEILSMRAHDGAMRNNYGAILMGLGELSKALAQFNVAYNQEPVSPIINKNLGMLMLRFGDAVQAAYFLERAVNFGGPDGDAYVKLSEAYTLLDRLPAALHALQSALQQYRQATLQNNADNNLQEKITKVQAWIDRLEIQLQHGTIIR